MGACKEDCWLGWWRLGVKLHFGGRLSSAEWSAGGGELLIKLHFCLPNCRHAGGGHAQQVGLLEWRMLCRLPSSDTVCERPASSALQDRQPPPCLLSCCPAAAARGCSPRTTPTSLACGGVSRAGLGGRCEAGKELAAMQWTCHQEACGLERAVAQCACRGMQLREAVVD